MPGSASCVPGGTRNASRQPEAVSTMAAFGDRTSRSRVLRSRSAVSSSSGGRCLRGTVIGRQAPGVGPSIGPQGGDWSPPPHLADRSGPCRSDWYTTPNRCCPTRSSDTVTHRTGAHRWRPIGYHGPEHGAQTRVRGGAAFVVAPRLVLRRRCWSEAFGALCRWLVPGFALEAVLG
jgi:hypothetical protein